MGAEIAVITVNWNGWRLTLDCVEALRASVGGAYHLYLIDNASTDESAEKLKDLGPDVTLVRSPVNGGWTGGNNLGLEHALAGGHEFVFLLNNDAKVMPDTLARLAAFWRAAPGPKPVLGPIQLGLSGISFCGAERDPLTELPVHYPTENVVAESLPEAVPTAYVGGAGLFAHIDQFTRFGGFDDRFYLHFDEVDWCYRATAAGTPLLLLRDAVIDHPGSATIGGGDFPLATYFLTRNVHLFLEKHASGRQRAHHWKMEFWKLRRRLSPKGRLRWVLPLFTGRAPWLIAYRRAVADYLMRRFGDCPTSIRALHRAAKAGDEG